jgi:aryl-alcohol dehydrogenase-like predicted oxidoreductase
VTGAICGARNAKQAVENAQAANATLCQEELDLIRNAFAGLPRRKKK